MKVQGYRVRLLAYRKAWAGRVYEVWRIYDRQKVLADIERAWTPLGDTWRVAGWPGSWGLDATVLAAADSSRANFHRVTHGIERKEWSEFPSEDGWIKPRKQPREMTPEGGLYLLTSTSP